MKMELLMRSRFILIELRRVPAITAGTLLKYQRVVERGYLFFFAAVLLFAVALFVRLLFACSAASCFCCAVGVSL